VLASRPAYGPAVLLLGKALLGQGRHDEFDRLAASLPDGPQAAIGRAVLEAMNLANRGDGPAALLALNAALALAPGNPFLTEARVDLAETWPEVHAAANLLLAHDPLNIVARARLARS
jgi:hypothetical protein